jgi:hypothetical protein
VAGARGAALPDHALARARLGTALYPGFGDLGVLVVEKSWLPTSSGAPAGSFWSVRDTGLRCVRAPCLSFRATRLNGSYSVRVSDLDIDLRTRRVELALVSADGLPAAGRVIRTPEGGRLFRATQIYLRAPQPGA